jgi:hypothetical protein
MYKFYIVFALLFSYSERPSAHKIRSILRTKICAKICYFNQFPIQTQHICHSMECIQIFNWNKYAYLGCSRVGFWENGVSCSFSSFFFLFIVFALLFTYSERPSAHKIPSILRTLCASLLLSINMGHKYVCRKVSPCVRIGCSRICFDIYYICQLMWSSPLLTKSLLFCVLCALLCFFQ